MKPQDLTVEQVKNELLQLIQQYPDRVGSVPDEYGETSCVYYLDEDGMTVSLTGDVSFDYEPNLVTPVCIVGQWIDTFHPEFKSDPVVHSILVQNRIIAAMPVSDCPFSFEVKEVLGTAQSYQDAGDPWSRISV